MDIPAYSPLVPQRSFGFNNIPASLLQFLKLLGLSWQRVGNDILSFLEKEWGSHPGGLYACGRTAKHQLVGYPIKHSLSRVFFEACFSRPPIR
jgi:hypothetical protein